VTLAIPVNPAGGAGVRRSYRFRLKAYPPLEGSPAVPVAGRFR